MSGQYDVFPEGIALEYAVENLTVLEQQYVALFIGKFRDEYYHATYKYIPGDDPDDRPYVLFRFSPEKGLIPANDLTGIPVALEIKRSGMTEIVDHLTYKPPGEEEKENKALFYRIPDLANVRIMDETITLAEKEILIYQFGQIVRLPVNFLLK